MSGPAPDTEPGNDWLNRIIILVIAIFALIAGLPLVVSGAASIVISLGSASLPSGWDFILLMLGLGLSAFAGMIIWKVFSGVRRKEAD